MTVNKLLYWIPTSVMVLIFAFSATMYFTKYEMVQGFFTHLGFPTWLIYPLAIAKVLGIIAVLLKKPRMLMEWAYAGFFFDATLALAAHKIVDGGGYFMSIIALLATVLSRIFLDRRSY